MSERGRAGVRALLLCGVAGVTACGSSASQPSSGAGASGISGSSGAAAASGGSAAAGASSDDAGRSGDAGASGGGSVSVAEFCGSALAQVVTGASLSDAVLVPAADGVPAHCLVAGTLKQSIGFRIALPEHWNHKLLFVGGGGFDGEIPNVEVTWGNSLEAGYAIVGDDSGHHSSNPIPTSDASFAADAGALANFADASTHLVLPVARSLLELAYGEAPTQSYFEGCSQGGREALIEAQRWPDDFDGIIARAPAYDFVGSMVAFHRVVLLATATGGAISAAKLQTLEAAELAACDADDGLSDGILSLPSACDFDPASLLCTGASTDQCLTVTELATLSGFRAPTPLPYTQVDGLLSAPPWLLGGEAQPDWSVWTMPDVGPHIQLQLQDQFLKYFVLNDGAQDTQQLSLAQHAARLSELSTLLDATNPDLGKFSKRSGKLILWHGLYDPALSPIGSADYYQKAVTQAGGRAKADAFLRFFSAPGVFHCFGGPGADHIDLVTPLDAWVTHDTAPDALVAEHFPSSDSDVSFTRPLCAYPAYPRYSGHGDVRLATSFACTAP